MATKINSSIKENNIILKTTTLKNNIVISETTIKPTIKNNQIKVFIPEKNKISVKTFEKGCRGEKGDIGASGSSSSYTYIAGEILGGHKAIVIDNNIAYYANCSNLSHINKPIGISNNASDEGGNIMVVFFGEMEEVSWNWDMEKPIWINLNGILSQNPPVEGFSCIIAFPVTATKIFVNKQENIIIN